MGNLLTERGAAAGAADTVVGAAVARSDASARKIPATAPRGTLRRITGSAKVARLYRRPAGTDNQEPVRGHSRCGSRSDALSCVAVLAAVASNWEIVAIAGGVPAFVLSLLLIAGGSRRLAALWAAAALAFATVSGFGIYYAFLRPVPAASASASPGSTQSPAPAGGQTSAPPSPSGATCAPSGTTISLRAANVAFDKKCLAAPAT